MLVFILNLMSLSSFLEVLYFLFPVAIANMMPVFVKRVPFLNMPLDFRKTLFGERILGTHKTWRGDFFGILGGILAVWLQQLLYFLPFFQRLSVIDYATLPIFSFGFLMGFGVMFGDALGSFFKRRLQYPPGASFMPFDQIVAPLGAMVFVLPYYRVSFSFFILALAVSFLIHLIIKYIGFLLKFERRKF